MIAYIALVILALVAVVMTWHQSRTWDQIVASVLGTVAWLVLAITVMQEVGTA